MSRCWRRRRLLLGVAGVLTLAGGHLLLPILRLTAPQLATDASFQRPGYFGEIVHTFDRLPADPWGRPFRVFAMSTSSDGAGSFYHCYSAGPNGEYESSSGDDLRPWQEESSHLRLLAIAPEVSLAACGLLLWAGLLASLPKRRRSLVELLVCCLGCVPVIPLALVGLDLWEASRQNPLSPARFLELDRVSSASPPFGSLLPHWLVVVGSSALPYLLLIIWARDEVPASGVGDDAPLNPR